MTVRIGLLVVTALAAQAPCPYEENCNCAAPGVTTRWKAA
jgi:hypothetical protein